MLKHFEREASQLNEQVIRLGQSVEQQLKLAITAVIERDIDLARKVIDDDSAIDTSEVELEEECLKLLALHQPVAGDLRFLVSVLKINNDLERVGDLASNIARQAKRWIRLESVVLPPEIEEMAKKAKLMLRKSLLALVELESSIARNVLDNDKEVDTLHRRMYELALANIKKNPEQAEEQIILLNISKRLERVADLASNIAEDVIYTNEGEIVRHGRYKVGP